MTTVAQRERAALADLFDQLGPDRPTLCEGWDTHDLLTHLVVRERRMDAVLASRIKPLEGWSKDVARGYHRKPWAEEVQLFRDGPQWFNPVSLTAVDNLMNTGEYLIHHEDARRGEPGWTVRELDPETEQAVVKQVCSAFSRWSLKKYGIGFRARFTDGSEHEIAPGEPVVTLTGDPGEILLWVSGRQRAAEVDVTGSTEALAVVERVQAGAGR
jgi:uncharacterized protein (TIGR03085 family)